MPSLYLHGGGDQENILGLEDVTLWLMFHVTHFFFTCSIVRNAPTLLKKQPDMITSEDKWIKGRKDSHHQILQDMEKNGSPQLG